MSRRAVIAHLPSLLAKGYFTAPGERFDPSGRPTNALYAMTAAVRRALAFKRPDVAVAIAAASPPPDPTSLAQQWARAGELVAAHGFRAVTADDTLDVVAAYARRALELGFDVVVAGSDKRLAQLVGPRLWWYDAYKDLRYTADLVEKRFGVRPEHVAGWLALTGDDDALSGVPGIGKKGSTDLVRAYGSIEAAIERADEVDGRTGKMLRASLELAKGEVGRATLRDDASLPVDLDAATFEPPDPEALDRVYREHGFAELLQADGAETTVEVALADTVEAVAEALAKLAARPVALFPLHEDPSPARGALAGVALAGADEVVYVPFSGRGRTVTPAALRSFAEDAAWPKLVHDSTAAIGLFGKHGVALEGITGDTEHGSHLAEPSGHAPHDLELIARLRLHQPLAEVEAVRGVGRARKRWSEIPTERAAPFAGARAKAIRELWAAMAPAVPSELAAEYRDVAALLARMQLRGIPCDRADLERAGEDFSAIAGDLEREIFELAGRSFNWASTKQLGDVLFGELGLPVVSRTKTGPSTATDALERIEHAHPIVRRVIRARQLQRLKDVWVTSLAAAIDPDGRVRSTFHAARSFSGRIINSSPDLGRVPGKTPEMARIRHAFRAPAGHVLMSVDYAQLGLYVLAHLTRDPALVEPLARGEDLHVWTAAAVLDLPRESIGVDERQVGKVVNFATFAGQGASALALQLGVDAQQAKEIILRFDRRYATVRAFQDAQLERVRREGFVETVAGRRWPMGGLDAHDPLVRSAAERMARRATHEGSVADVSRRGLLRADQALRAAGLTSAALLIVHDEVLFEVPEREVEACARLACEAMRGAFELVVPLRVGCEVGPSWSELRPLA